MKTIFTSESVTEGHPDKVCDTISDWILDLCLQQDPQSRVACETLVKNNCVVLAGEITTNSDFNYQTAIYDCLKEIGYDDEACAFNYKRFNFINLLGQQSKDIKQGVDNAPAPHKSTDQQGAGDQGMMFGYATDETEELMPAAVLYAHRLSRRLTELRKSNAEFGWLRPDGKTQVSVEYDHGRITRISAVVVSTMHERGMCQSELKKQITEHVIKYCLPAELLDDNTEILINPTGNFEIGGPEADCGLTGRKIIVDTYGGKGRHGGGAFSGKDPSKVDRSGAYMCRWVAKNLVKAGLCRQCEIQVAYAIGHPEPVSIAVDSFGSSTYSDEVLVEAIKQVFNFRPAAIIEQLDLLRPIYRQTTNYGHFGRQDANLPWEQTDKVAELQAAVAKLV